jgi:hypothetical protein
LFVEFLRDLIRVHDFVEVDELYLNFDLALPLPLTGKFLELMFEFVFGAASMKVLWPHRAQVSQNEHDKQWQNWVDDQVRCTQTAVEGTRSVSKINSKYHPGGATLPSGGAETCTSVAVQPVIAHPTQRWF